MVESDEDFIPPGKKKPRSKKTKKGQVPCSVVIKADYKCRCYHLMSSLF